MTAQALDAIAKARVFSLVVAATHKGGIGKAGAGLPWRIPEVYRKH